MISEWFFFFINNTIDFPHLRIINLSDQFENELEEIQIITKHK